jgi:flagellar protein FlaG
MRIDYISAAPILTNQAANAQAPQLPRQSAAAVATEDSHIPLTTGVQPSTAVERTAVVDRAAELANESEPFISQEDIEKLISRGNCLFEELGLYEQYHFVRHDVLPRTMIRLVNIQEDRIIREFPPKKILDLVAALQDLSGVFLDERV